MVVTEVGKWTAVCNWALVKRYSSKPREILVCTCPLHYLFFFPLSASASTSTASAPFSVFHFTALVPVAFSTFFLLFVYICAGASGFIFPVPLFTRALTWTSSYVPLPGTAVIWARASPAPFIHVLASTIPLLSFSVSCVGAMVSACGLSFPLTGVPFVALCRTVSL